MEQKTQSNSKKVLYLITKSNFGGAQKYVYELACEAKKNSFDVSVAVGGNGVLIEKLRDANITVYTLKSLKRDIGLISEIKSFFEIYSLLKKVRPDILHVNSSKAGGTGALVGRICGVPKIIFTIHGWAFNEDRGWLSKLIIKKLYWIIIFLSHTSIAVSEHTKKQAEKIPFYFLIKNKIVVIKNGTKDISFFERDYVRNLLQEKFNINKEDFVVGTLAELHPIKGLGFLIKTAKILSEQSKNYSDEKYKNIKILIFGEGQEKNKLGKMIVDLGLKNKVILGGFLENGSQYLKGLDVFILPSLSEAMPLSLLEAGQAELPIIATNVGGIPEIIENKKTGLLIEVGNEESITDAINFIIENKNKSEEMGTNLKNKIVSEFNVENFYKKTFETYK
jgi:glycosyltransferase involved in cell wall biosynthesis